MIKQSFLLLVALLGGFRNTHSYSFYRDRIPNGNDVRNPCNTSTNWNGVGHQQMGGGGARNPFGMAFASNNHTWNDALCRLDSDGDGKTNGEELGDPNCVWGIGQQPAISPAPSHPGICEPLNDPICQEKNSFLACETQGFQCPVLQENGIFPYRVGFNTKQKVPSGDTTYMCQGFDLPDGDFHLVATESEIDNMNVAHHIVIYGCSPTIQLPDEKKNSPYECFMGDVQGCGDIIAVWSFGQDGNCFHKDIGFRVGQNGYKQIVFEMHWNNPELRDDYEDASTMLLYMTPNLRPNDAGVLITGEERLIIPPQTQLHSVSGFCSAGCLSSYMEGPIKIVGVFNHMHLLGIGMEAEIERSNGVREEIKNDMPYDYNTPLFHTLEDAMEVYDGDSIHVTCHFTSMARNKTTFRGIGTYDEMCYSLLTYYPKENLNDIYCISFGEYDSCAERNTVDVINGCRPEYRQPDSPEILDLKKRVKEYCFPGMCLEECLPVAQEIMSNPCLNGTLRDLNLLNMDFTWDSDKKLEYYDFWYRADSCMQKLMQTQNCKTGIPVELSETNAASMITISSVLSLVTFIALLKFKA